MTMYVSFLLIYIDGNELNISDIPMPPGRGPASPFIVPRWDIGGPKNGSVMKYDGLSIGSFGTKAPLSFATSSLTFQQQNN